jgi:hypothetical protein
MAAGGKGTNFLKQRWWLSFGTLAVDESVYGVVVLENLFRSLGVTTTSGAIATTRQCLFRRDLFFFGCVHH